jgi:glycosyltransferase involved in cell wall biosynthesis
VRDEPFLSVVIPAYNEAGRIPSTLREVGEYLSAQAYTWEVLVVDDGSADETAAIVERHSNRNEGFKLVRVPHGGKGWAVKHGMLAARGRYRFMADADLAMPIDQLGLFLPNEDPGYDVAIGSREAPGANRVGEPSHRHLMGRIFNSLIRLFLLPGLTDTQCGFKCFRGNVADELFSLQRIAGWGFDMEVLFIAKRRGLRIVEVPIEWHYRSESKIRPLRDSLAMTWEILRVRCNALTGKYRPGNQP